MTAVHKLTTIIYGILFSAIWSLSFIATRTALTDMPPIWLAGWRLFFAGIILFVCLGKPILDVWMNATSNCRSRLILGGLFSQGLYLGTSYWALVYFPTSIVNIVVSSLPLITVPIAYLLLQEKVKTTDIIAFLMCTVGVAIALSGTFDTSSLPFYETATATGVLLISVLSLALGNVLNKSVISKHSLLPVCGIQFLTSGIILLAIAVLTETIPSQLSYTKIFFPIIFLILAGSIFGTILWFKVLSKFTANGASTFFLLTPIFGIIGGSIFFDEVISSFKIGGVIILSLAIILRLKSPLKSHHKRLFSKN